MFELFSLGGLRAFQLRHVIPQIKDLYAYLDQCESDDLQTNQSNHVK